MNEAPVKNRIFRAVGSAACLLAVMALLGGHWAVLQSFAWARMMGQFARQESLASALTKTFDGRHPCALCLVVQQGHQAEQRSQKDQPYLKLGNGPDLLCDLRTTPVPAPSMQARQAVPFVPGWHDDFLESPHTPPPRAA